MSPDILYDGISLLFRFVILALYAVTVVWMERVSWIWFGEAIM